MKKLYITTNWTVALFVLGPIAFQLYWLAMDHYMFVKMFFCGMSVWRQYMKMWCVIGNAWAVSVIGLALVIMFMAVKEYRKS